MTPDVGAILDAAEAAGSPKTGKVERVLEGLARAGVDADRVRQSIEKGPLGHKVLSTVLAPVLAEYGLELTSENIRRHREKADWHELHKES